MSAFANSGQVCISLQRLYVHQAIAPEFIRRFMDATAKLKVGNPIEMKVMCIEAFAPLVSIYEYASFEEAVRMVEDSPYGLQAGVYTNDMRKAFYAVDHINAGGIMINDTSIFRVDHMPYGGNKMSGLGREGVRFAIDEMTNIKMVVIKP
jgi:acyl-CoA reductase-like NAD-dependent aldehyde dehydrogenase